MASSSESSSGATFSFDSLEQSDSAPEASAGGRFRRSSAYGNSTPPPVAPKCFPKSDTNEAKSKPPKSPRTRPKARSTFCPVTNPCGAQGLPLSFGCRHFRIRLSGRHYIPVYCIGRDSHLTHAPPPSGERGLKQRTKVCQTNHPVRKRTFGFLRTTFP